MRRIFMAVLALALGVLLSAHTAQAAEEYRLSIRDHRFVPDVLDVPAGEKIRLIVSNEDATAEEFESYELNREKIIKGGSEAVIFIGPLKPGEYPFFGEFNPDTAQGRILVKE